MSPFDTFPAQTLPSIAIQHPSQQERMFPVPDDKQPDLYKAEESFAPSAGEPLTTLALSWKVTYTSSRDAVRELRQVSVLGSEELLHGSIIRFEKCPTGNDRCGIGVVTGTLQQNHIRFADFKCIPSTYSGTPDVILKDSNHALKVVGRMSRSQLPHHRNLRIHDFSLQHRLLS
ncbi:hypothetical protein CDV55_105080 [Aspergillus turcosus]|uniref:Uncharacterized protein n=1 Tax=Aspergillus turcosus TaxID=1245748 RepID=A0A229Z3P4_9EURO|nr:hypothetical protein CDV55_105080 [Aspergillus turcosus]RLL99699.1 hypothetical protein CFD26_103743 [Aspergillus turcosus]